MMGEAFWLTQSYPYKWMMPVNDGAMDDLGADDESGENGSGAGWLTKTAFGGSLD